MKIYLWYSNSTADTGKLLAKQLNISCGTDIPDRKYTHVLTWGARLPKDLKNKRKLKRLIDRTNWSNPINQIELNANKYLSLSYLRNHKIATPAISAPHYITKALYRERLKYPIIGRTVQHMSGSGFFMCLQRRDIQLCKEKVGYFIQHIPVKNEYRVHIVYGEPIRASKKVASEGCNKWVRTNSKGWSFKDIPLSCLTPEVINQSIKSVQCLGLNFGAVDIIEGEDKKPYILEVNTAPSLNKAGREKYLKLFEQQISNLKYG